MGELHLVSKVSCSVPRSAGRTSWRRAGSPPSEAAARTDWTPSPSSRSACTCSEGNRSRWNKKTAAINSHVVLFLFSAVEYRLSKYINSWSVTRNEFLPLNIVSVATKLNPVWVARYNNTYPAQKDTPTGFLSL